MPWSGLVAACDEAMGHRAASTRQGAAGNVARAPQYSQAGAALPGQLVATLCNHGMESASPAVQRRKRREVVPDFWTGC